MGWLLFIFASYIITPPIMYIIGLFSITDQENGISKRGAQKEVLKDTIRSKYVWFWAFSSTLIIYIGIYAHNYGANIGR